MPGVCANPSARNFALAWSWASFCGPCSNAMRPAAARIPACLHAAAQRFAVDAGAIHQLCTAHQQRSYRRAQAFREAEHYGVGLGGELRDWHPQRDGGIEHPRAVKVNGQSRLRARCRRPRRRRRAE